MIAQSNNLSPARIILYTFSPRKDGYKKQAVHPPTPQDHHKPSWIQYVRQDPETRGIPLLVVVNERGSVPRSKARAQRIASELGVARHQVHERPCRVISACLADDSLDEAGRVQLRRDLNAQFLSEAGLGWFCAVDRAYSRGSVW